MVIFKLFYAGTWNFKRELKNYLIWERHNNVMWELEILFLGNSGIILNGNADFFCGELWLDFGTLK